MGLGLKIAFAVAIVGMLGSATLMAVMARSAMPLANSKNLLYEPRHPVTDPMWRKSRALTGKLAPMFELGSSDGSLVRLSDSCKNGPVVLIFTKDGCPCSIEAQQFFNQLAKGFEGRATFLGIIDADQQVADKYQHDFSVPYAMLLAGDGAVFKSFDAGQSVYTTLIGSDGTVIKQWPGYSKDSLMELDDALARASMSEPVKLDLTMAPIKMSSGCKFEFSHQ